MRCKAEAVERWRGRTDGDDSPTRTARLAAPSRLAPTGRCTGVVSPHHDPLAVAHTIADGPRMITSISQYHNKYIKTSIYFPAHHEALAVAHVVVDGASVAADRLLRQVGGHVCQGAHHALVHLLAVDLALQQGRAGGRVGSHGAGTVAFSVQSLAVPTATIQSKCRQPVSTVCEHCVCELLHR